MLGIQRSGEEKGLRKKKVRRMDEGWVVDT